MLKFSSQADWTTQAIQSYSKATGATFIKNDN